MGKGTIREERDGSREPWGGPGVVGGPSRSYGTGRRTLGEVLNGWLDLCELSETGRGTHREVRDGSGVVRDGSEDPCGGTGRVGEFRNGSGHPPSGPGRVEGPLGFPGWVWRPSGKSGTCRRTLEEIRDGSGDPRGVAGRVWGPSRSSGTGRGTLAEVWDGSGEPRGGVGRVGRPSGRSGTGRGTLGEIRDGSGEIRGDPGGVGGPSGRSGMGRRTLGEVRDGFLDTWGRSGTGRRTLR